MALVEGCKHSLEISIPAEQVESETSRVVDDIQKRAKLQGFRPGKAPASLIRRQFAGDIRQKVLENLIPVHLQKQLEAAGIPAARFCKAANIESLKDLPLENMKMAQEWIAKAVQKKSQVREPGADESEDVKQ